MSAVFSAGHKAQTFRQGAARLSVCGLLLTGMLFCLLSCSVFDVQDPEESPWPKRFQVYFSEPGISPSTGMDRGLPERIGAMIRSAKKSVDINIYELSVPAIYQAVVEMHNKGLKVRMVGSINNTHYEGYKALMKAGVPMRLGNPDKIMHNKFVVVDRYKVSMGSMNYTGSGALLNNENVVFMQDKGIGEYYTKEMDNMFINGTFGLEKIPFKGFTDNEFTMDEGEPTETTIRVYFTPYVGAFAPKYSANNAILEAISNAKHSIHFAVFAFTSIPIADAVIYKATNDGVRVYGVFDKGWHEASVWSTHQRLLDAGINIRMDGNENFDPHNPYHGSKIHDKIMTIDAGYNDAITLTGSFNFSPSAAVQGNDENCILIQNRAISIRYRTELEKLYRRGSHPAKAMGGDGADFLDVIISEINWAGSRSDSNTRTINDKYVELWNISGRDINISGWQLWGICSTTYRMLGFIFPKGTKIPAGGYHILGWDRNTTGFDWNENWTAYPYLGTMHDASKQNFLYLRLKDVNGKYIDIAGQRGVAPFAGDQGAQFSTMQRTGLDGTSPASWITASAAQGAVRDGYRGNTLAAPGYSGKTLPSKN